MKPVVRNWILVATALSVGAGTWLGYRFIASAAAPTTAPAADDAQPLATVTTMPLRAGQVSRTITAFGSVTAEPGSVSVMSVPVECRVRHLFVAGGQSIQAGANLIDIEPSPDARFQLIDAKTALAAAKLAATTTHQRSDLKLATNADVQTADAAVDVAQQKFDDLTQRGVGENHRSIACPSAGVVAKVDVQEGQLVPAGAPLIEIVPSGQIEVRLGIEPVDVDTVRAGQPVSLSPTTAGDDDEPISGTIRLVTHRVNPDSRLVDVFAVPAETDRLPIDQFVRGELTVSTVSGLVVPHAALMPDDDGFSIFTVEAGKAVKHLVKVAIQTDTEAAITGAGLHEGDAVVVGGALELDDGTAVTIAAPATAPAPVGDDK